MASVVADWRRAALVDRFLRPRIAAGAQNAPPLPPLAQYLRDAGVSGALPHYAHDGDADADTYAASLDGFVHDADVYAAPPAELAAAHGAPAPGPRPAWYFVSPARRTRCGGFPGGEWVAQGHDRHKEAGGVRHVRRFFYVSADNPKVPAGWVMVENGITREGNCHEELVLCELYRARRTEHVVSRCHYPRPPPADARRES